MTRTSNLTGSKSLLHNIHKLHFLFVYVFLLTIVSPCLGNKELQCQICRVVVDEIEEELHKADPHKIISVGGYSIDPEGNRKQSQKKYAYSETHMHDILDEFCSKMDNYAKAKYKESGALAVIKLTGKDGFMNPETTKVDFLPDDQLNANLKFYCEEIIDEYEDDIIKIFTKKEKDPDLKLCAELTGYCPGSDNDTDDYNFEREDL